jgi:hypothetical protein
VVVLDQNYRSSQTILDAANAVITRNEDRPPKDLWTDAGPGDRIVRYRADDEDDEARWITRRLAGLHDSGRRAWSDLAVFYRTNAQSRAIEEQLIRFGVPYRVVGGTRFFEIAGEIQPAILLFIQRITVNMMCLKDTGNEFMMTPGKRLDQIDSVAFFTFALKPIGHNQINTIGLTSAMRVDPGKFFAQLLG